MILNKSREHKSVSCLQAWQPFVITFEAVCQLVTVRHKSVSTLAAACKQGLSRRPGCLRAPGVVALLSPDHHTDTHRALVRICVGLRPVIDSDCLKAPSADVHCAVDLMQERKQSAAPVFERGAI